MPNCYQLPVNIYTQYTQVLLSDQADIKHVVHICTNRKPLPLFDNLVADDWNGKVFRRRRSTAIVVHCQLPCSRKTTMIRIYTNWILDVLLTKRIPFLFCINIACRVCMNHLIACFHFLTKYTI